MTYTGAYTPLSNGEIIDYIEYTAPPPPDFGNAGAGVIEYPVYFYNTTPSVPDNSVSSFWLLGMALAGLYGMTRFNLIRDARGTR